MTIDSKTLMLSLTTLTLASALLAACDDVEGEGLGGATHDAFFAVVSTNYTGASAVSLLGEDGAVVEEEWVGSGTENPDLRTPFSEDVVLATSSGSRRYLTAIERSLGVVTLFDLNEGTVIGQLRTDDSPAKDEAAYHSNPQDVAFMDDGTAWISRWQPNPDPDADEAERGNDLIEVDVETWKRGEGRIDLSSLDETVLEPVYDEVTFEVIDMVEATASASPARLVRTGDFIAVGLTRITASFSYGPGALAIVDPASGEITDTLELPPFENCGDIVPVAGEKMRVLVPCIGDYAFLGPETGLTLVEVSADGKAEIVESFAVADHDGAAATGQYPVSLGGTRALAVASGALDFDTGEVVTADAMYVIDLASGDQELLFESDGAFSIGAPSFDPATGLVLVPDAGDLDDPSIGLRSFQLDDDGDLSEGDFIDVAEDSGLAARQVVKL
jgi:hypothetical protein